jgi:hypothetical protein
VDMLFGGKYAKSIVSLIGAFWNVVLSSIYELSSIMHFLQFLSSFQFNNAQVYHLI